jgi:hypothetical protein
MKPIVIGVQVHNDDDTVLVVCPSDLFALASEPASKCDTCMRQCSVRPTILETSLTDDSITYVYTQKPTHLTDGLWNHILSRVHSRCREVAAEATCAAACFLIFRAKALLDCKLSLLQLPLR